MTDAPAWIENCIRCGRIIDSREMSDGGDPHGCEHDQGWVCSRECANALLDAPAPAGVTVQDAAKVLLSADKYMPEEAKQAALGAHLAREGVGRPVAIAEAWRAALRALSEDRT